MEDDEDEAQPIPANDEVINTIIEMNRHNTLVIQNLVKDVATIKKNTVRKAIIKKDDKNGNQQLSHFCVLVVFNVFQFLLFMHICT